VKSKVIIGIAVLTAALAGTANAAYLTTAAGEITNVFANSAWSFLPAIGAADESGIIGDLHSQHDTSTTHHQLWVSNYQNLTTNEWSATFDQAYALGDMWVWNSRWSMNGTGGFRDTEVYYTDTNDNEQQLMGPGIFGAWEFAISNPANYDEDTPHQTEIPFRGVEAKGVRLQQVTDWGAGSGGLEEIRFNLFSAGPPNRFEWIRDDVGSWSAPDNWSPSTGAPPNNPNSTVVFGDFITGPTAAVTHDAVTVNRVEFNSANPYAVAGLSVNLATDPDDPNDPNDAFGPPSLSVSGGTAAAAHQFQAVVNLQNDTTADIATGSTLTFNNALNLSGNTLTKTGGGTLLINNVLNSGGGMVIGLAGVIGGSGTVGGDLINTGASLSPGSNPASAGAGVSTIPEPSSLLLLTLAGMALGWHRRRALVMCRLLFVIVVTSTVCSVSLAQPIQIPTNQRQLFLDDYVVASTLGLQKTMHQPEKRGAVVWPNQPWEAGLQTRSVPAWDEHENIYKLWVITSTPLAGVAGATYAESTDGINWTKPILQQYVYDGSTENNFINVGPVQLEWPDNMMANVVYDPDDLDPSRRYKGFLDAFGRQPIVSPDGIHWTKLSVPEIPSQDESNLSYDRSSGTFIATLKTGGAYGRAQGIWTSTDFETWTNTGIVFQADATDQVRAVQNIAARLADPTLQQPIFNNPAEYKADIYNMGIFQYEGQYVGMPSVFHTTGGSDGFHLIQLASSRDLGTWQRLGDRQPFIGPSPVGEGAYDLTQLLPPSAPVVHGDELWFYYTGIKYRVLPADPDPGWGAVNLAALRRDGFISLDAGDQPGTLLTKPFVLPEGSFLINAKTAPSGSILARLLDAEGLPIGGYDLADSDPFTGDSVTAYFTWGGQAIGEDLLGQTVSVEFRLQDASLYSFGFSAEPGTRFEWKGDDVGSWSAPDNWTPSTGAPPDNPNSTAVFGDLVTGPTAAVTHDAVTVNRVEFNSANPYTIAGLGSVNLATDPDDPNYPNDAFGPPLLSVSGGTAAAAHQFQAVVNLQDDTTADIATGSTLTFNNALNLGGNTLAKTGGGTLLINNVLNSGGGTVTGLAGVIGGSGTVSGDLINTGASVSPGSNMASAGAGDSSVPEPSTLVLLTLGAMALGWYRRRRFE